MKRLLILLFAGTIISSCDGEGVMPDGVDPVFLRHFIVGYENGDYEIGMDEWGALCLSVSKGTKVCYYSPEVAFGDYLADTVKFLRIAERNGDMSYNRTGHFVLFFLNHVCFADNFEKIHLVCTGSEGDAPWDANHPVGSSLDDVAELHFASYADFIRNGYPDTKETMTVVEKRISELMPDDLAMIMCRDKVKLVFDNPPSSGKYELEMTLTTTEGKVKTARYTYDAEAEK